MNMADCLCVEQSMIEIHWLNPSRSIPHKFIPPRSNTPHSAIPTTDRPLHPSCFAHAFWTLHCNQTNGVCPSAACGFPAKPLRGVRRPLLNTSHKYDRASPRSNQWNVSIQRDEQTLRADESKRRRRGHCCPRSGLRFANNTRCDCGTHSCDNCSPTNTCSSIPLPSGSHRYYSVDNLNRAVVLDSSIAASLDMRFPGKRF